MRQPNMSLCIIYLWIKVVLVKIGASIKNKKKNPNWVLKAHTIMTKKFHLSEFCLRSFEPLSFVSVGFLMGETFVAFILYILLNPQQPFLVDFCLSRSFSLEIRLSLLSISMALLISTSPFQGPFVFYQPHYHGHYSQPVDPNHDSS